MGEKLRIRVLYFLLGTVNLSLRVNAGVFQYEVPIFKTPYIVNPPVKILPYISDFSTHFQQPLIVKSFQPAPYLYHNIQPFVYTTSNTFPLSPLPLPVYNSQHSYPPIPQQNFGGYQNPNQWQPQVDHGDSYNSNYRGGDGNYNNNNYNSLGGYSSAANNFLPSQYNNNNQNNNINPYEENIPRPRYNQNIAQYSTFNGNSQVNNIPQAYSNNGFLQSPSRKPVSGFESASANFDSNSNNDNNGQNFGLSGPNNPSNNFEFENIGPSGGFNSYGRGSPTGPSPSKQNFPPNLEDFGLANAGGPTGNGFPLSSPSNTASVVEKFQERDSSKKINEARDEKVRTASSVIGTGVKSSALKQSNSASSGGYSSSSQDSTSIENGDDKEYKGVSYLSSLRTGQEKQNSQGYGNSQDKEETSTISSISGRARKPVPAIFGQRINPFLRSSTSVINRSAEKLYSPTAKKI